VILIGPPGAGKGTQAAVIRERRELAYISTGDILRENVRGGTPLGLSAKSFMDAGHLVPDDVILGMVRTRLNESDAEAGFLMDGFPRTIAQAEVLDALLRSTSISLDAVILLDVSDDEVVRRLSGRRVCNVCNAIYNIPVHPPKLEGVCDVCGGEVIQRDDDRESVIRDRLAVYHGQTSPLVKYYETKGLLRRVDGTGNPDAAANCLDSLEATRG
jgi:adenylate kinase